MRPRKERDDAFSGRLKNFLATLELSPYKLGKFLDKLEGREKPRAWEQRLRRMIEDAVVPTAYELRRFLALVVVPADVEPLAKWLEGDTHALPQFTPVTLDDTKDPRRVAAPGIDHRTPFSGTAMPILDPEAFVEGAIGDVKAGRDPMPKLIAAKALLQALSAARNAGLAGVLVAGTWGAMGNVQENAKIRREEITTWAEVKLFGRSRKSGHKSRRTGS